MQRFLLVAVAVAGCGAPISRYPSDVQAALASSDMRRMETTQLLVYYPEGRRELAERMAARVELCATEARLRARVDNRHSREKMVVVVPDAPFNNAYVMPPALGLEDVAVVPAGNTLDFATSFGLPPDPGMIGCHEIIHYVHAKQIAGLWGAARTVLGELVSPQVGLDAWFFEGLATHYEALLQPGAGRPRWPTFTSMFHAAYAGGDGLGEGQLSEQQRHSPFGHHYLVGSMFIEYLAETYGDAPLWRVIEKQASSTSVIFSVNSRFHDVYGQGVGPLFRDFRNWVAARYPVRTRPAHERVVQRVGSDARWAWGPAGEVAIIDADVDAPARLRVWSADGALVDDAALVDILPPRRQVIAAPLLISGMSFARDGALWFTSIDLGGTYQTTRLYRWRRGEGLRQVTSGLGPGGAITADGSAYLHMIVDGDRWSLASHPIAGGPSRVIWEAPPGQYALRVAPSPDGARLAVSAWNGKQFVVWILDAHTGARIAQHRSPGSQPLYDAAWTPDGRLMMLEVVGGRFQASIANPDATRTIVGDAPYGAIEPRAYGNALRFLARDGWNYTLDEIPLPPPTPAAEAEAETETETETETATATETATVAVSDAPYSRFDGLFRPSLHSFALSAPPTGGGLLPGVTLGGGDQLDLIRWSLTAFIETDSRKLSSLGGVLFNDLAPWQLQLFGSRARYTHTHVLPERREEDREYRAALATLARSWRDTYAVALQGAYFYQRDDEGIVRLYGPRMSITYSAVESTLYTNPRRGLVLNAVGAWYPRPSGDMRDGRVEANLYLPPPLTRRHVVHATVRSRALLGAPRPLLQIGGWTPILPLWSSPTGAEELDPTIDQPAEMPIGVTFAESLRGFEDLGFETERATLVDLRWSYPLIIDRGLATILFLPAGFVRQLDLELFGAAASFQPDITAERIHAAGGGALSLRFTFARVPLLLRYQVARRFTDDRGYLQLVGLGAGI